MVRLHDRPEFIVLRRFLRHHLTKPEVILWSSLKDRGLCGYKFRRQHGIGRYIVDFYCPALRLVIELDGAHDLVPPQREYDRQRDAFISSLGIGIVRIANDELLNNKYLVLEQLAGIVKRRGGENTTPPSAQ